MKKILNGSSISLIIVKLIIFVFIFSSIMYYAYSIQTHKLANTKILTKEEYIKDYDNYVSDQVFNIKKANKDLKSITNPVIMTIVFFTFWGGYFIYQLLQLLLSVFIIDRMRKNNNITHLDTQ